MRGPRWPCWASTAWSAPTPPSWMTCGRVRRGPCWIPPAWRGCCTGQAGRGAAAPQWCPTPDRLLIPPPPAPPSSCPTAIQQRLVSSLREYRMLHMRGGPAGLSPNALVLPERLKCMPLLTLGVLHVLRGWWQVAGGGVPRCWPIRASPCRCTPTLTRAASTPPRRPGQDVGAARHRARRQQRRAHRGQLHYHGGQRV